MAAQQTNTSATTSDDILDRGAGKAPRPGLCTGTFREVIRDFERGESSQKKTPYVRFICSVQAALEGKAEDIQALGDLTTKRTEHDFYLTEGSLFRLDDFLGNLGLKLEGRTYKQVIPETVGKPFVAQYVPEEILRDGKPTGEYRYRAHFYAPAK